MAEINALRAVMLGSGSPGPDPRRMGPSVAIVFGGRAYLVDAGAGVGLMQWYLASNGVDVLSVDRGSRADRHR